MGDRKTATEFYNQAVSNVNDKSNPGHLTIAYQLFSSACHADPTWWEAHYQAGNNNSDLGKYPAAIANWRQALHCATTDEQRAKVLVNIGWRLHSLGRDDEALAIMRDALRLDESLSLAWLNLSLVHQTLDDHFNLLFCAGRAYEMDPDNINCEVGWAFANLFNGNWAAGLKHFEIRFKWRLQNFLQFPYPKWEGEEGKTVFLVADQGLGDTLSFARFVKRAAARSKYMHLYIQPDLLRLFTHSFIGIPNINLLPAPAPFPQADCWTTFVSLPYALKLADWEIEKQAHIDIPRMSMGVNWRLPGKKLHIGIAWAGSPLNDIDKHRNIPIECFFELAQVPGVQLYALQIGERSADMDHEGGAAFIRNLAPYVRDVLDTVALLNDLDMVITCESALGHIAAAVGKECWIPYSYQGRDYRIGLRGEQLLWTPKHRIFRQEQGETWVPVFERIVDALREKVK